MKLNDLSYKARNEIRLEVLQEELKFAKEMFQDLRGTSFENRWKEVIKFLREQIAILKDIIDIDESEGK